MLKLFFAALFLFSPLLGNNICLTMVVRNEEAVIKRCLDSVKDIVDCISIYDAGSTDNTLTIINRFMRQNGIPGKIHDPIDSSLSEQTVSLLAAQRTLRELGFNLSKVYLLTLDADMVVREENRFSKESLKADAYLVAEKSSCFCCYYYNAHFLRASLSWEYNETQSERWSSKGSNATPKLRSLIIDDYGDGEYTASKRDIGLLNKNYLNEPENTHYIFALAQSLRCQKQYNEAIKLYQMRAEKEGNQEEVWFSLYMIGKCYQEKGEWETAVNWYLKAYQYNPKRADSLRNIARYYRFQGQNDLSYIFAKHGLRIPYSSDQNYFDVSPQHDYYFNEELSICAYYTPFKDEGYTAANEILLKRNIPWPVKDQTYKNILYYVQNLPKTRLEPINIDLPLIQKGLPDQYNPMNPSIQKTQSGYKLICRAVNYTQTGAKIFNTVDETGVFRTRNFLVDYDTDFKLISQREIIDDLPRERIRGVNVEGLEDCRIFEFNKGYWFTCTVRDTNPTGNPQIALCKLSDVDSQGTVPIESLVPLKGPDLYRCEKNWLPFVQNNRLEIIYSCDPLTLYAPHLKTGDCETIFLQEQPYDLSHWRGSAAPIEFDEGFLMLVHEVVVLPDYERRYLHRFVYLDENFNVKKASKPFTFLHIGVEYCCSMTLAHSENQLVMPIGVEDREAYLCFVDIDTVRSLLQPLPILDSPDKTRTMR